MSGYKPSTQSTQPFVYIFSQGQIITLKVTTSSWHKIHISPIKLSRAFGQNKKIWNQDVYYFLEALKMWNRLFLPLMSLLRIDIKGAPWVFLWCRWPISIVVISFSCNSRDKWYLKLVFVWKTEWHISKLSEIICENDVNAKGQHFTFSLFTLH